MADRDNDDRLLFCPFCRECYEGERECPVHELELVEFQDLPKQAHERRSVGWDEAVAPWELRFGRAWLAVGATLCVVGFFGPLVLATTEAGTQVWTGLQVATGPAKNLWTVPFAAALFLFLLVRRRTPIAMLGARLAALVVALTAALSLAYSLYNVHRAAARTHGGMTVEWGMGVWLIVAGTVLLLIGSVRFGAMPRTARAGHATSLHDPESEEDRNAGNVGIDASAETPSRSVPRGARRGRR